MELLYKPVSQCVSYHFKFAYISVAGFEGSMDLEVFPFQISSMSTFPTVKHEKHIF